MLKQQQFSMLLRFISVGAILSFFFSVQIAFSQDSTSANQSFAKSNSYLALGFEKLVNTLYFTGNLAVDKDIYEGGRLTIADIYKSTGLKSSQTTFRDDQVLNTAFTHSLSKNLKAILKQYWYYSSDAASSRVNKLEILRGTGGINYSISKNSSVELNSGAERIYQVGISSTGVLLNGTGIIKNLNYEDYIINGVLNGEYIKHNMDRLNNDLAFGLSASKDFSQTDKINLAIKVKRQNRDFVNLVSSSVSVPIESRLDFSYSGDFGLDFAFFKELTSSLKFSLEQSSIDRNFKQEIADYSYSAVKRNWAIGQLSLNIETKLKLKWLEQTISVLFNSRNEENILSKKFSITDNDLASLNLLEQQKDNQSSRTSLLARTILLLSKKDTFSLNYSASLFKYDTPSQLNYDDRDELMYFCTAQYTHQFNQNLKATLTGELQMSHLVFLFAQRSAMNNWNRSVRLSPSITIATKGFQMSPEFEVLANYTVYDFQSTNGLQSFSYRLIGCRDTIFFDLGRHYSLQSRISLRYSERGVLYWGNFSEYPQNSNFEQFFKLLIFAEIDNYIFSGIGVRYYGLEQNALGKASASSEYSTRSIGPEASVRVVFANGSYILFSGWYEYQKSNNNKTKQIPNINLQSSITF